MRTFHNDPAIKARSLDGINAKLAGGRLGLFADWRNDFGGPVYLTLDDDDADYSAFPARLGLPEWLAVIEDELFPLMPEDRASTWPRDFLAAIPVGVSAERLDHGVRAPFILALLRASLRTFDRQAFPEIERSILATIAFWERDDLDSRRWRLDSMTLGDQVWEAAPFECGTPERKAADLAAAVLYADEICPAEQMTEALDTLDPARADAFAAEVIHLLQAVAPPREADPILAAVRAAG